MKVLSSVLVIVLILSGTASASMEYDGNSLYQTVIGNTGLKISDITNYDLITRAEMIDIVINLTQIQKEDIYHAKYFSRFDKDSISIIDSMLFDDWVPTKDKEELVKRLYECQIIIGCGDNKFRPNDFCTFEEAVTFIVRSLGWMTLAESRGYGGFPEGYIRVAEEIGLLDNIKTEEYTNQKLPEIIFNSLFVNTLRLLDDAYYEDWYYVEAPCALAYFHDLNYIYGYATKCEGGIKIDGDVFLGEVHDNKQFSEGYVFCIYDEKKRIVICQET